MTRILLLYLFVLPFTLDAQFTIRGKVLDQNTGEFIPNALISIKQTGDTTRSDLQGSFTFSAIDRGSFDVECRVEGYALQRILNLELKNKKVEAIYFQMQKGVTESFSMNIFVAKEMKSYKDSRLFALSKRIPWVIGKDYSFDNRYKNPQLYGMELRLPTSPLNQASYLLDEQQSITYQTGGSAEHFSSPLSNTFYYIGAFEDLTQLNVELNLGVNLQSSFQEITTDLTRSKLHILAWDDAQTAQNSSITQTSNRLPTSVQEMDSYNQFTNSFNNNFAPQKTRAFFNNRFLLQFQHQHALGEAASKQLSYGLQVLHKNNYENYSNAQINRFLPNDSLANAPSLFALNNEQSNQKTDWSALAFIAFKNKRHKVQANFIHFQNALHSTSTQSGSYLALDSNQVFKQQSIGSIYHQNTALVLHTEHLLSEEHKSRLFFNSSIRSYKSNTPDWRNLSSIQTKDSSGATIYSIPTEFAPSRIYRNRQGLDVQNQLAVLLPTWNNERFKADFKFGIKNRFQQFTFKEDRYLYTLQNTGFFGDVYELFSPSNLLTWENNQVADWGLFSYQNNTTLNDYKTEEYNTAAFLEMQSRFNNQIDFIAGFHFNYMDRRYTLGDSIPDYWMTSGQDSISGFNSRLPLYGFTLALSKTIKEGQLIKVGLYRYNYTPLADMIAPVRIQNYHTDFVFQGNPRLNKKATTIHHFNLQWEYFPRLAERISAGLNFKTYNNQIELVEYPNNPGALIYTASERIAWSIGAEVKVDKRLDFMGKWAKDLSLNLYAGYQLSQSFMNKEEAEYVARQGGDSTAFRTVSGLVPFWVNAQLNYEISASNTLISIGGFWGDRSLQYVTYGNAPDIYSLANIMLHAQIKQQIGQHFQLLIRGDNLLNNKFILAQQQDGKDYIYRQHQSGANITLVLRYMMN